MIESKAFAWVGGAYPRRHAGSASAAFALDPRNLMQF
jgi:hypothetical protein